MTTENEVIRRFRKTLRQFERITSSQNKNCCAQVSMAQCHVLLEIDAAGVATTRALARTLNLDTSTISRTVDSLVKASLVARTENPDDRRSVTLRATTKGSRLAGTINSDADRYFAQAIDRIPPKQRATVLRNFEVLVKAFVESREGTVPASACGDCSES